MTRIFFEYRCDPIPKLYETLMKRVIRAAVSEKYPRHRFEVNVTVVSDRAIRKLNREQRGIDKATDVLSFPFFDFGTPEVPTLLGDIVISRDTAYRQAKEYGHSPRREFCFLAAHSALHLLGYDHE
ncbi:MAG: rRNA maturation RNase YbeY, partial [Clostridia bacterium]|nr:rRNA maturation RNase YbeY [Clostridia bacterium]